MQNQTLGSMRSTVGRALGLCSTSDMVRDLINEAQSRLLNRKDMPVGTLVPYRFCSSANCITLPRQVATVEGYSVCGVPGVVLPIWYNHHINGPGAVCATDTSSNRAIDKGIVVSFDNVHGNTDGTGNYIRVYATSATDLGKKVILKYLRSDTHEKFYSSYGGSVQEGEEITMVAPPAYAVTSVRVKPDGLYSVIKATTEYPVSLYEYDGVSNLRTLATYEPSETLPTYRRMYLPGLTNVGTCSTESVGCDPLPSLTCSDTVVDALVKLQHVAVVQDNDSMVIGNVAAIKLMAMAIQREEQERFVESRELEAKAAAELDGERAAYLGTSTVLAIQVQGRDTFGLGGNDFWSFGGIHVAG